MPALTANSDYGSDGLGAQPRLAAHEHIGTEIFAADAGDALDIVDATQRNLVPRIDGGTREVELLGEISRANPLEQLEQGLRSAGLIRHVRLVANPRATVNLTLTSILHRCQQKVDSGCQCVVDRWP